MGIEAVMEEVVVDDARKAGWFVEKIKWMGRRGAPDRLFIKDGRVIFIEFKRPGKGNNTSTGQDKSIAALKAAGVECYVFDTPTAAYRILGVAYE